MSLELVIDEVMKKAEMAFLEYKKLSGAKRADFLDCMADKLESRREVLVPIAMEESHLPAARLNGELTRTVNQLKMFGRLLREGSWVEASIDTGNPERQPMPKPDLRKMLRPVGPVVVFGASNFPFAFSTAGGDSASVLASGSTLVIKAHPGHPQLSQLVFDEMAAAVVSSGMPENTIQHVTETSFESGKLLVQHPLTSGVGFTGSFKGGRALLDYSMERENPIPVFAEMGSINPVVLFPHKLEADPIALAKQYASSITAGVGQFCTNPGLILAVKSPALDQFLEALGGAIQECKPQTMLHAGIKKAYATGLQNILDKGDVATVGASATEAGELEGFPTVVTTSGATFVANPYLSEELFGPYSLVVVLEDKAELKSVLSALGGQLTTTLMATETDMAENTDVLAIQEGLAGRVIINDVPTGVEVCSSMVHGGPYPATTDGRFTSVGTTAIKRWVRPVSLQGYPDAFLPEELKASNPLHIWRLVDNEWTNK